MVEETDLNRIPVFLTSLNHFSMILNGNRKNFISRISKSIIAGYIFKNPIHLKKKKSLLKIKLLKWKITIIERALIKLKRKRRI